MPRAGLVGMLASLAVLLERMGVLAHLDSDLAEARETLAATIRAYGPDTPEAENPAKRIATMLEGSVPIVWGAELTAPVAYRWKCQLNENAEVPAFWSVLPEADHNEICGFAGMGRLGRDAHVVMLRDPRSHRQVERRFDLTRELVSPEVRDVTGIEAEGQSPLARMLDLVMLGDYASIYLAFLRDVDPGPVGMIDRLKERLATTGHGRAQGPAA
jgi:glucose/mannose-6-phosphate isomerase